MNYCVTGWRPAMSGKCRRFRLHSVSQRKNLHATRNLVDRPRPEPLLISQSRILDEYANTLARIEYAIRAQSGNGFVHHRLADAKSFDRNGFGWQFVSRSEFSRKNCVMQLSSNLCLREMPLDVRFFPAISHRPFDWLAAETTVDLLAIHMNLARHSMTGRSKLCVSL